jgi:hypothetical protein
MPFDSAFHFEFVAVVRSDEVRAHKQEDDICCIDVLVDCLAEILASRNPAVMPRVDQTLTAETREMDLQLVTKILVHVGIREEESCHPASLESKSGRRLISDDRSLAMP